MYCKGLTRGGHPCCNKVSSIGDKYCSTHSRDYEECPICYDDMLCEIKLSCDHTFCSQCLQSCTKSACPLCRKESNFMARIAMKHIANCKRYALLANNVTLTERERIKANVKYMNSALYIHHILFKDDKYLTKVEYKLDYLLKTNLVIEEFPIFKKFKKEIESYKEKTNQ